MAVMSQTHFDAERLLAEISWVRALALRLTQDGHEADDLVQETLAVALASGPGREEPASLRAWLGGVLRNVRRAARRRRPPHPASPRIAAPDRR